MANPYRIRFLGGAGTVSGSKYLITNDETNILVDCGLFQGLKELRLKNWDRFPVDPSRISAVVLTHAHIDHSGYIPRLVKEGFRGTVFCTPATLSLCKILLPDSGYLQEEEANWMNRKKLSKHSPALPLFTMEEATKSLDNFMAVEFGQQFDVCKGVRAKFNYAGHILGAASVNLEVGDIRIAFSGDVGREEDPIMKAPEPLGAADYLVVESTYGNREHTKTDPTVELNDALEEAVKNRGVVIIPAFTVGRAQSILYYLSKLKKSKSLQSLPMYLNSPMATDVTKLFEQFHKLHKLDLVECKEMCSAVHYIQSVEESIELNKRKGPMVIISASGMATGGRVIHHLKQFAPSLTSTILFTGFQAAGTRGRAIVDGAKEVKIHGQMVPIKAKVREIENLSAHADANEIKNWLSRSKISPKRVFITHGEAMASAQMRKCLEDEFRWNCETPSQDQEFRL